MDSNIPLLDPRINRASLGASTWMIGLQLNLKNSFHTTLFYETFLSRLRRELLEWN